MIYITITTGGNELNHAFQTNCLPGGVTQPGCIPAITAAFMQAAANLTHIMSELRVAAGVDTRIAISTHDIRSRHVTWRPSPSLPI